MDPLGHQDYYAARAATARDLARCAADPAVAAIHAEFATRYDFLAAQPALAYDDMTACAQAA